MLKVFGPDREKIGEFINYEELTTFINAQTLLGQTSLWGFTHRTPEDLKKICSLKRSEYITLFESKALENNYGLVEIRRGSDSPLRQIVVVPELDVQSFQKSWCLDYCRFKGWLVTEVEVPNTVLRFFTSPVSSPSSLSPISVLQNRLLSRKASRVSKQFKNLRAKKGDERKDKIHLIAFQQVNQKEDR